MRFLVAIFLLSPALAASALAASALDWTGTWTGDVTNYPNRPGGAKMTVRRDIGPMPTTPNTCTYFRTTYYVAGKQQHVKDYQLCRGAGPDDYYIDESGLRLPSMLLGDALASAFHYDDRTLFTTTRVRGDEMEEEIYSWKAEPAAKGVVPLKTRSLQRLLLRRAK